jgi:hypothetical protein
VEAAYGTHDLFLFARLDKPRGARIGPRGGGGPGVGGRVEALDLACVVPLLVEAAKDKKLARSGHDGEKGSLYRRLRQHLERGRLGVVPLEVHVERDRHAPAVERFFYLSRGLRVTVLKRESRRQKPGKHSERASEGKFHRGGPRWV